MMPGLTIRLMRSDTPVPTDHPRLLGSRDRLQQLAQQRAGAYQRVQQVARQAQADDHSKMISLALVSAIEQDQSLAREAIALALKYRGRPDQEGACHVWP